MSRIVDNPQIDCWTPGLAGRPGLQPDHTPVDLPLPSSAPLLPRSYLQRKKRAIAPETASVDAVKGISQSAAFTPHSTSQPGITCVEFYPSQSSAAVSAGAGRASQVITGGIDKTALIFDTAAGKVVGRLPEHGKRVSGALLHPSRDVAVTSSFDGVVRVWAPTVSSASASSVEYAPAVSIHAHAREAVGVALHPTGDHVFSAGREGSWSMIDINAGRTVNTVSGAGAGSGAVSYECLKLHPDGLLLALGAGASDKSVRIFDLRSNEVAARLEGHTGGVSCLSFSENGIHFVSGCEDGTARFWDLRKIGCIKTLQNASNAAVTSVSYDWSGHYLATGAADGIVSVWESKALLADEAPDTSIAASAPGLLSQLRSHSGAVTGLSWGAFAKSLVSVGMDRQLVVYNVPQ